MSFACGIILKGPHTQVQGLQMRNKGHLRRATSIFNSLGCLAAHGPIDLMVNVVFLKKKK